MNMQLQQAIAAARTGKRAEAKALVNQVLLEEPNNVHAWFLNSVVADNSDEQVSSLKRVLELEPNHEIAQKRLSQLEPAWEGTAASVTDVPEPEPANEVPIAAAGEPLDFVEQADASTVPPWLAQDEGLPAPPVVEQEEVVVSQADVDEIPEWLQEEPSPEWKPYAAAEVVAEPEPVAEMSEELESEAGPAVVAVAEPAPEKPAKKGRMSMGALEVALIVLIILAVAVVAALVYVIFLAPA
jgi:hypothetical protein